LCSDPNHPCFEILESILLLIRAQSIERNVVRDLHPCQTLVLPTTAFLPLASIYDMNSRLGQNKRLRVLIGFSPCHYFAC
jgi:hypothetical protein